ncbi:MAG: UDP-N-acetylmuramate--L-alanine ligase [Bacteroidetes bacterium]|nr:MAG: UDP-N-acetylmuramate--L-alanine ligase [Bacteroidota bacterium]
MNLKNIHTVYFLGIGGIGMSALALYFLHKGVKVYGYDKTPSPVTDILQRKGAKLHFDDNPDKVLSNPDLVIYTPAVPKNTKVFQKCTEYSLHKRAEVLGWISKNIFTVAVAGTHGKTTISSLITHILKHNGKNVIGFVGGIMKNYQSNLVLSDREEILVIEADEYDRSFLHLHPDIAVITSTDADHLDIYGEKKQLEKAFEQFARLLPDGGLLIKKKNILENLKTAAVQKTYHLSEKADYYADNVHIFRNCFQFDIYTPQTSKTSLFSPLIGFHNIENTLAAAAVALELGLTIEQICDALKTYQGVKRRGEYIIEKEDFAFIDDYAHHPKEIEMIVNSVKEVYPEKKITGVFQPHLYSRTRDFAEDFAQSLEPLNQIILLDIYPARELPVEGVSSRLILDKIQNKNKQLLTKEELLQSAGKEFFGDVLLTMGAGDIDRLIEPLKQKLSE